MPIQSQACTVVPPGGGEAYWIVGDQLTFKLGAAQTRGLFAFAEAIVPPDGGPPPHIHRREDEMFFILDGQFAFTLADRTYPGSHGDAFYLPKGIVHTFKNFGGRPGRFLVGTTPCGFERFIPEAGCPCTDRSAPPPPVDHAAIAKLLAACPKYGMEVNADFKPSPPGPARPKARELWVLGVHVRMVLTSADTGGKFSVAEVTCAPGTGVPPHTHVAMDEIFFVRDGTFEFSINGERVTAPPGTVVHVPPNALHGFRNVGDTAGSLVDYHTPGGFERFFEECGVPCTDRTAKPPPPPTPDEMPRLLRIFERHGMTVPPLPPSSPPPQR